MTYQHIQEFTSVQADPGQPLIGIMTEEQGHEVVRYFTKEQCSGQVKTDTQLSNQSKLFICSGTHIPEIRMLPSAIVEHLDVINDIVPCLLSRGVITM